MITSSLRSRGRLLAGCALILGAAPAFAQAVQGAAAPVGGSTGVPSTTAIPGGLRDTVRVNTPTSVINWRPNDVAAGATAIDFLPATNELRFISALPTYTVLNRIIPAGLASGRTVAINGGVESFVNVPIGVGPQQRGGNIWFYSPNGLLVGATGRFNVGSLALTTLDHPFNAASGALAFGGGGEFLFGDVGVNPVVPASSVIVSLGATLSANNGPNSYVALIGPRVEQRGSIVVNGTAALVAAEQVNVDLAGGLLSLSFFQGTTVANAITHTGSTTGPAQTGGGRIVLAAVPKNTVITTLVSGTLGYTPAATATVQNGAVVLSAGYGISGGVANVFTGNPPNGNITIGNTNFTSSVFGDATGTLTASPTAPGALTFSSNATLAAELLASIGADSGETVSIGGNLSVSSGSADSTGIARIFSTVTPASLLSTPSVTVAGTTSVGANRTGRSGEDGESATGATAQIVVTGGNMTFGGNLNVAAQGSGGDSFTGLLGGSGTGGNASLTINGGTVTVNGALSVRADGLGGGSNNISGNGTGGNAAVTLNTGTSPTVLNLNGVSNTISATGSISGQLPASSGGDATGGRAALTINSGTINAIDLSLLTSATGGEAQDGQAGTAFGGTSQILINAGRFDVRTLTLNSDELQGAGGNGAIAGRTQGTGIAAVDVSGTGVLSVGATGGGSMSISANAVKASARIGVAALGGTLVGGTARLTATSGGSITTDATAPSAPKPPVLLTASVVYDESVAGGPSGIQRAGTVIVRADGGTMSLHKLDLRANALVRTFVNGTDSAGRSFGGTVSLTASNGGTLAVRTGSGATPISAYATGGNTAAPANGTGGTLNVAAQGGTLTLPDGLTADVRGYSGSGTTLGGVGGTVNVSSTAGAAGQAGSLTTGITTLNASGQISAGLPSGTAGTINIASAGAGQTVTFAQLDARTGEANGAPTGAINVSADNTPINVTTGADLRTSGNLSLTMTGLAGRLNVGGGLSASGFNITLSHLGVAPGTNLTSISAGQAFIQAGDRFIPGNDLMFVGPATVRAGFVRLTARRDIGGADGAAFATGNLEIGNGRNVTFRTLDANGTLFGYNGVSSTTPFLDVSGTVVIGNSLRIGTGNIDVRAGTGIDIADAGTSATGQVLLRSTTGDVRLATSGVALGTRPNGITLTAVGGTARFVDIFSRASITAAGAAGVVGGNASAALGILATSGNGGVTVGNVQATSVTLAAATNIVAGTVFGQTGVTLTATTGLIAATSVTAPTGAIAATGSTGVDIATVTAAGPVTLSAPNGAVRVATNLAVTGNTTATGQSIFLRSLGALNFASLNATAGNLDVSSAGALSVTTPQATGSVLLASTGGNVSFGAATAGTALTVAAAGTVTGTSTTATAGPLSITGATGITIPTLFSGGTTTLSAANGAISVATNVQSAGLVTASGRSVFLRATAGLSANALTATAGNVDVSVGGSLAAANIQTSLDAILNSGAVLTPGAVTAGRDIVLTAPSVEAASLTAPRDLRIVTTGLARATGTIAATGALTVNAGQTNFQTVNGGSVAITSGQGVIFGALTSGSTVALNAGDDAIGTSVVATGNVAVTAGRNMNFGVVQAGGNATLYGNTTTGLLTVGGATIGGFLEARGASLNFGNVTAGTDAILSSYNGGLTVGNVTAGDDIFLTVNGSFANAATISPDSQTGIVSNTVNTLVAGNLRSTGLGSDTTTSGPRTFAGAGPTGNVIRVRASGAVQTGTISTGGNAIIASDLSTITTQAVSAAIGVSVFVRGNANMGDIVTAGNFSIGDSSQIFSIVPSYGPFVFGFSQTSTFGGATLGSVTAGNIGGTTRDGLAFGSLAATGFTAWTSALGSITGGALSAGNVVTLRAGGNIGFTTASAGTSATLSAGGRLDGTSITAGGSIDAFSQTGLTLGSATANGSYVSLGTVANELRAGPVRATTDVIIGGTDGTTSANIILGTVTSGGSTRIEGGNAAPGTVVTGAITTGTGLNVSATSVATGDISSGGDALVTTFGGALTVGNATASNFIANSSGSLTTGRVTAVEDIRLSGGPAPALMTTGDLTAGDDIIATGNAITTGNLLTTGLGPDVENNGSAIDLQLNRIATGTANSAGTILYAASQPITFTSTTSRFGTTIRSFGAITGGNSTAGTTLDISGGELTVGNGRAGGALTYQTFLVPGPGNGAIQTGTLDGASVRTVAQGSLSTGLVTATDFIDLAANTSITTAGATTQTGDIQLRTSLGGPIASGALRAGGNLSVSGQAGNAVLTTLDAGGRILIGAGGGTLAFTRATAGGLVGMSAGGNIAFGAVQAGGTFQAQTPGTITGTSATSAAGAPTIVQGDAGIAIGTLVTNGVTVLSAVNGALVIGTDLRSTAPVSATGRSIFLRGSGPLAFSTLQATAGNLDVQTAGALNAGAASSTGILALTSTGGALSFTTAQSGGNATLTAATTVTGTSLTSGGTAAVAANSGITIPTVVATGTVNLATSNGAVRVATNVAGSSVSANGNGIFLRATGPLATNRLSSTADIDVQSVGNLATDFTEASGNVTFVSTTGSVSVNALGVPPADLVPANATITAATTATLNNVQVGNTLNVASPGATTINGAVVARIIDMRSGDIVIGGQARLGTLGTTTQLTLANNSTQNRTTIGGAGTSGYSLSGAEIGRLFGGNITINAPVIGGPASTAFNSARTPDVTVEAFTFAANTNLGAAGTFAIVNGGKVRVVGTASITGAVNGQTFAVRGDEAVEVLDAGAITMNGAAGLAGTIDLTSRNIVASSSAALADFAAASTLSAISDRAGRNDGAVSDGGYLQAGGIRATLLNSTLIIQNTGAATTNANRDYAGRRGFTVGAGGFTVIQGGSNPVRIAINGRQVGATTPLGVPTIGGFVTGLDTTPLIRFQPFTITAQPVIFTVGTVNATAAQQAQFATTFDLGSTNNGCAIANASACRVVPNDPIRDILLGDFGEGSVSNLLPLSLVQLREYVTPEDEPLIDEPVTGAGNDDLWSVDDAKAKCDPVKEKCPA